MPLPAEVGDVGNPRLGGRVQLNFVRSLFTGWVLFSWGEG